MTTFNAKATQTTEKRSRFQAGQMLTYRVRGWTGIVYIEGHRKPFRTGTFHNKAKAAKAAAEKMGRWLTKTPDNVATAIENSWQAK